MVKEKILECLSDDFKRQNKNNTTGILILSVLVICVCALFFYLAKNELIYNGEKKMEVDPVIFVIIAVILISVIIIIFKYTAYKTIKKGHIIYNVVSLSPDKIVWFYKKATTTYSRYSVAKSYSICIYDDAKNVYETAMVSKEGKEIDLWKNLNEGCPNAVKGYRPEWYSIYYKNPAGFMNSVLKYEEQFKK